jgi:hypothetical protein
MVLQFGHKGDQAGFWPPHQTEILDGGTSRQGLSHGSRRFFGVQPDILVQDKSQLLKRLCASQVIVKDLVTSEKVNSLQKDFFRRLATEKRLQNDAKYQSLLLEHAGTCN